MTKIRGRPTKMTRVCGLARSGGIEIRCNINLVVVTSASIWWLGFGSFGRKCEIGKDEVKKKMIFGGRECNILINIDKVLNLI